MIGIKSPSYFILKGHGVFTFHPEGPARLRNPPESAFRKPGEKDIPLFAHDGHGNVDDGEWVIGPHGEHVYRTARGDFRHGVDAAAFHLGNYFRERGDATDPKKVLNHVFNQFNEKHEMRNKHGLTPFENDEWRKNRIGPLAAASINNRATRTHNGTLITGLHNKNPDTAPTGKFVESYSFPPHRELGNTLEAMGYDFNDFKELTFTKYPYIYAHLTAPNTYGTQSDHPDENIPEKYMRFAPEGYFPDRREVRTWETTHNLPKVMHYPKIGKKGQPASAMKRAAHEFINEALSMGVEHIPDIEIMMNRGHLLRPEYGQYKLREVLTDPNLRDDLINDVARSPSLMFLFGRSGQGEFQRLMNYMEEKYGMDPEGLSLDELKAYYGAGESGKGTGMHTQAGRLMALAHKSGITETGSQLGEHEITAEELKAMALPYSDQALKEADRFQIIIEALADHQASARGQTIRMPLGETPESPMMGATVRNMPQIDPETGMMTSEGLDPHMDAFTHRIEDYAPTTPSEAGPLEVRPGQDAAQLPVSEISPREPAPTVTATPRLPSLSGVTPAENAYPAGIPSAAGVAVAQPLHPEIASAKRAVGGYTPEQLRAFMGASGRRHPQREVPTGELSPFEQRFQQTYSDPRQMILEQYMKAEDAHLPIMERILKQLERLQIDDARNDESITKHVKSHFSNADILAKHLDLTRGDIHTISHSAGDWYKIAKQFKIEPNIVKIIKVNQGMMV